LERKLKSQIKIEMGYFVFLYFKMKLTVYWGNLFIFMCVLTVSWFATRLSTLEALGISLTSFVAANVLENFCGVTGLSLKPREIVMEPKSRVKPVTDVETRGRATETVSTN